MGGRKESSGKAGGAGGAGAGRGVSVGVSGSSVTREARVLSRLQAQGRGRQEGRSVLRAGSPQGVRRVLLLLLVSATWRAQTQVGQ